MNILAFRGRIRAAAALRVFLQCASIKSSTQALHSNRNADTTGARPTRCSRSGFCTKREHYHEKNHCNAGYRHGSRARKQRSVVINENKIHILRSQIKWLHFRLTAAHRSSSSSAPWQKIPQVSALNPAVLVNCNTLFSKQSTVLGSARTGLIFTRSWLGWPKPANQMGY